MSNMVRCNCGNPDCNNYVFTDEGALHAVKKAHGYGVSSEEVRMIPGPDGWLKLITLVYEQLLPDPHPHPGAAARLNRLLEKVVDVVDYYSHDHERFIIGRLTERVSESSPVHTIVTSVGYGGDAGYLYETIVVHPLYNGGKPIIVDGYEDYDRAYKDHAKWVKALRENPYALTDIYTRKKYLRGGE